MDSHPPFPNIPPLPNRYAADSESAKSEDDVGNGFGRRGTGGCSENVGYVEHGRGRRGHADVAIRNFKSEQRRSVRSREEMKYGGQAIDVSVGYVLAIWMPW